MRSGDRPQHALRPLMTLGKTDLQRIALKEGGSFDPKGVQYWTEVDSGKAHAGMVLSQPTGTMMRKTNQLNVVVSGLAAENRLTDTAGSPSESYDWRHMANVLREWRHEFWHPFIKQLDLTRAERVSIEARVRKELYP